MRVLPIAALLAPSLGPPPIVPALRAQPTPQMLIDGSCVPDALHMCQSVPINAAASARDALQEAIQLSEPHPFSGLNGLAADVLNICAIATFGLIGAYATQDAVGTAELPPPPSRRTRGRRRRPLPPSMFESDDF